MRKLFLAAALTVFAIPSFAADMPTKPIQPPPPAVFNWSGFGIGGSLGYDWASSDSSITFGKTTLTGNTSPNGFAYGGFIYAQKQFANGWVPGVQVSWIGLDANDTVNVSGLPKGSPVVTKKDSLSSLLLAEFKLGYANLYQGWLPYGTVGAACETSKTTLAVAGGGSVTSSNGDNCGWTVGVGIDWAAYQTGLGTFILGLKYNFIDLGTQHTSFPIGGGGGGFSIPNKQKDNLLMVNFSLLN